jgi:hypothetical protein
LTQWLATTNLLLRFPRGERSYYSQRRDIGEICSALNVPICQLFYDGEQIPKRDDQETNGTEDWASVGPGQRIFRKLRYLLNRINESDRKLLMYTAEKKTGSKKRKHHT